MSILTKKVHFGLFSVFKYFKHFAIVPFVTLLTKQFIDLATTPATIRSPGKRHFVDSSQSSLFFQRFFQCRDISRENGFCLYEETSRGRKMFTFWFDLC